MVDAFCAQHDGGGYIELQTSGDVEVATNAFSSTAFGAAAAGTAALATPAIAQGRVEWKMVTTWPKNFPGLGTGAQRAADRITQMTDGRVTVKLYAAGELVPAFECFDAVSNGTAEMYHGADYYWQGKHPAFAFFTAVPMGFTAPEINAWVMNGGGQALWDELSGGFGIKPFVCGNTGVQMGGWFREPINAQDDLKGGDAATNAQRCRVGRATTRDDKNELRAGRFGLYRNWIQPLFCRACERRFAATGYNGKFSSQGLAAVVAER